MIVRSITIFSVIAFLSLFWSTSAVSQQSGTEDLKFLYSAAIDKVILHCKNKTDLRHSRSEHLRRSAALSCMKAAYLKGYKDELIQEMIKADIGTSSYKIQYYLNQRFFNIIQPKYVALNR
ncbi:MAG: hypothetical protein JSV31_10275 [Desulfobacterales bacterium]|nr:MAG: hypothetical protein JSV31_10275 [Desulfobacterales bacterium]